VTLAQIAAALGTSSSALLDEASPARVIALLGLRGAGKSAVGRALSRRTGLPFVELDARVEAAAGLSLAEIFELHGEDYYRRLEFEALEDLLRGGAALVVATGGGIVAHRETFDLLNRGATTVWLEATPQEHWDRVVAQGDHRPMENDPLAMAHLRELLEKRESLYRSAHHRVRTSGRSVAEIAATVARLTELPDQPAS
jgi:XRE family aerobic/anaerobic benzoate catabolism transcriptional regulator